MLKRLGVIFIPLFCLWHMAAVALYLVPDDAVNPVLHVLAGAPKSFIRPYILITSQWQKWDIFSPNPLRRVSVWRIESQQAGDWRPIVMLDPAHLPAHMRVKELKLLGRLSDDWKGAAQTYLLAWCRELNLPVTNLRLAEDDYVIPLPSERVFLPANELHSPPTTSVVATVRCPSVDPSS